RGDQRGKVPAPVVLVGAVLAVQIGDLDLALGDQVVVHQDDAQQRPHDGADGVHEDGSVALPGREGVQAQGDHRRDVAAALEADLVREGIGNVEGRRHEVGDDIDAQGGHGEGQGGQQRKEPAVELGGDLLAVQEDYAIDLVGGDRGHAGDQREQDQVDGQAPEIALAHHGLAGRIAGKVAEVQVQRGEISDPGG